MGGLSWLHWIVVLVVVILVFGTKKLGNIGSDLGKAIKGFKDGVKGEDDKTSAATSEKKIIDVETTEKNK